MLLIDLPRRKSWTKRDGQGGRKPPSFSAFASEFLDQFCREKKSYVQAQYLAARRKFERIGGSSIDDATFNEEILKEFEKLWDAPSSRLLIVPGKDAIGALNKRLQEEYGINIAATSIIDAMTRDDIPPDVERLIDGLATFAMIPRGDAS
jgi:hypothetical protein